MGATLQGPQTEPPQPTRLTLRRMKRQGKWAFFAFVRGVVRTIASVVFGFRVRGAANIPPTGPVLVVSNHLHNLDPVALNASFTRPIFFMAKRELFEHPTFNWLIRGVGAFPVNRQGVDRAALRHVGLLLEEGLVVGMLPEGTRSPSRALQLGNPGVAMIALRHDVPIVPVGITGTEHLPWDKKGTGERWFGRRVMVTIGKPFHLPPRGPGEKPDLQAATDRIMLEIAALLPPEYRGVYADRVAEQSSRRR